ncbi:MAG: polysaccharide deacetylase family protein [Burkholderiaceae bacterium]|nr:polysaccharide deacetylase family protein [Burkholderiaceae bacterium]
MDLALVYAALQRRRYKWFHRRLAAVASPSGVVSFTFDDFPATAADAAARMLEREGLRGTFYLAPGLVDSESPVGAVCSRADLERLHHVGHEIGNHTYSHANCTNASKAVLLDEVNRSQSVLTQFSGTRHFAFPFGAYDEAALMLLGKHFDTLRTVDRGVNSGVIDLNRLRAFPIYESSAPEELEALIQQARDESGWLILYTHDVCESPSSFGCTPARFGSVIAQVKNAGLAVRTVGDVYRSMLTRKSSNER